VALPLLKQEFHDINVELQGLRQPNAIWRRGARRRLPNPQCRSLTDWDDLRHWRLTIQDGNRFAATDGAQVLAQAGLQFGDAYVLHDHIMTRNGHVWQVFAASRRQRGKQCLYTVHGQACLKQAQRKRVAESVDAEIWNSCFV
jgi:hypothetical protein